MLESGDFKAVSKYRLAFTSRAKKRGAIAQGEIFCLVKAVKFIDAFSRLRREPDVMAMRAANLSNKNLRAAGVNVAYWLHGRKNQSLGRFAELQLLHDHPGTAANYEDFYCVDADGHPLKEMGILKDAPLAAYQREAR